MLKNQEKPCLTFFAFLPPYIGVSGSLVSRMRKILMRSIDWYQKFLISRLAARYSTVFVFSWRISIKAQTEMWKINPKETRESLKRRYKGVKRQKT